MSSKNHFTIFIPAYNVQKWAELNLSSAFTQDYYNYDLFYVDDNSTDNTESIVKQTFANKDFNGINKTYIKNSFNKGKMFNLYNFIKKLKNETIVVILDGDDWLANKDVLNKLNNIYTEETWMTCGSYVVKPHNQIVSPEIPPDYWDGNIREKSWQFSHLATFRKSLFSKIKKKDFLEKTGNFLSATSDQAIMWPMAEMSGPEHMRVVKEVLYCYNLDNPLSDHVVNRNEQLSLEKEIRSIKPYSRLKHL